MNEDIEAIRVMGFWYWLWCRIGAYRAFNRWVHRFNWHHCTVIGPFEDGVTQHWCQWCGLRYEIPKPSYPLGFPDDAKAKHHSRCHTVQYGSPENYCDCDAGVEHG